MSGNETEDKPGDETEDAAGKPTGPQVIVSTDEDWKNRVKAEDAALDQQFRGQKPAGGTTEGTASAGAQAASAEQAGPREETTPPESSRRETSRQAGATQFPEPSFAALLGMLSTQAMVALGLIPNPVTHKPERELPVARYFIDLLAVLEQKTAGNLDQDEAAALEESLHTLRMAYIQLSKATT